MRVLFAITLVIFVACCARSDELSSVEPIRWQEPFEAISASKATTALVLILITNEDPFHTEASTDRSATLEDAGQANQLPPVWCADVMSRSYHKALDRRADLRGRLRLQSISAGLPKELTGGEPRNVPARAVVALCDGNYRLLAFAVGVPDTKDLLTLIEDGEDVATLRQLHADNSNEFVNTIAQRSSERLSRLWRTGLEEMVVAMQGDLGNDEKQGVNNARAIEGRLRLLSETFEPSYFADVQLRFALTETTDRTRLVILEQHPQTRRPWCEAMIPFTAGSDFSLLWRELVESIWGHQPVTNDADAKDLLEWYDLQANTNAVVLSIKAPFHLRRLPWPPVANRAGKRGVGWQKVHALALEHPFRAVDPQQLAALIRSRELSVIDIQQPSTARYVLLEPKNKKPFVIRQGDPPGRFAGLLKRSASRRQ